MTAQEIHHPARPQRAGRRGRRTGAAGVPAGKPAWRHLSNPLQPQRAFSDDQIATIHDTALRVLEELGIRVLNQRAIAHFRRAGAGVDAEGMVHIDRGIIANALASAPASFTIGGGKPDRDVLIGGRSAAFACVGGPPNVMDLDRGRRPGTEADMLDFFRLSQHFEVLHMQGSTVEPQDVPVHLRHYAQMRGQLRLSDKPMFAYKGAGTIGENHQVCPIHPEYAELPMIKRDVDKARALMGEAGQLEFEHEIITLDDGFNLDTGDAIGAQLRDAGFSVKRTILPGSTFWNNWTKYPFSLTQWAQRPLGVQVLAIAYRSGEAWNESGYADPEFDAMVNEALTIVDVEKRRELMAKIEARLQDAGVIIQPFWRKVFIHSRPAIRNVTIRPDLIQDLSNVWIDA